MTRGRLHWVNLAGVGLLAVLAAWQWNVQRVLESERGRLERQRREQASQLRQQATQLTTQTADLEYFRQHSAESAANTRTQEVQRGRLERELEMTRAERDGVQASLARWESAVQERDARLEQAVLQLRSLVEERDRLAHRVNELTEALNARTLPDTPLRK